MTSTGDILKLVNDYAACIPKIEQPYKVQLAVRMYEELRTAIESLVRERDALRAALAEPAEPLCACKEKPASQCPGEWEPGCDLGNNEKFVRAAEPAAEPVEDDLTVAYMVGFHKGKEAHPPRAPLTEKQIDSLFCSPIDSERARWLRSAAVEVVRKTERAHGIKESE
jgi:hypothetical protein